MYKIKLGFHIFNKKLMLNALVVLQLLIIAISVNSIAAFAFHQNTVYDISKNLTKKQMITVFSPRVIDIDSVLPKLSDGAILYYNTILDTHDLVKNEEIVFNCLDYDILSSLRYKLEKGKWYDKLEKGTNKVVVTHNSVYKVGDNVDIKIDSVSASFEIVGMLRKKESVLSLSGNNRKIEGLFDIPENQIVFYADSSNVAIQSGLLDGRKTMQRMVGFSKELTKEEFEKNNQILKDYGLTSDTTYDLLINSKNEKKLIYSVMLPIVILIMAISIFSFFMINYVSFNSCKNDLQVISNLGASKKDIITIMGVYLSFPAIITIVVFAIFGKILFLPFSDNTVITFSNYIVTFMIILMFYLVNFISLFYKLFYKGGVKETMIDVK